MISSRLLVIPFLLQVICMGVDELYYHHQRKLPRWERIGHLLDTLAVLVCLGWILVVPPSSMSVSVYLGLSITSCLLVTKDEWVHHKYCSAGEQWMHSLQFVLHSLVLISAGLVWPALHEQTLTFVRYEGFEPTFFKANLGLTFFFGVYQLIYWNFLWRPAPTGK